MNYYSNDEVFKGNIVFNDLDKLISLNNEKSDEYFEYLKEDLFQVVYEKDNIILDIGWYNQDSSNGGRFIIYLIKDFDWENPILKESCKEVTEIKNIVKNIIRTYNL